MIYVDTSAVLAEVLAEDVRPPVSFWQERLISSRLIEYETITRLHASGVSKAAHEHAERVLGALELLELSPEILRRALEPFPAPVRTLDALHLASACFLASRGKSVRFATYDRRQMAVAVRLSLSPAL